MGKTTTNARAHVSVCPFCAMDLGAGVTHDECPYQARSEVDKRPSGWFAVVHLNDGRPPIEQGPFISARVARNAADGCRETAMKFARAVGWAAFARGGQGNA